LLKIRAKKDSKTAAYTRVRNFSGIMGDPEEELQGSKVELLELKTKRSVSITSTATLADGSHLELHQACLLRNGDRIIVCYR
jgi:hypothetical protein